MKSPHILSLALLAGMGTLLAGTDSAPIPFSEIGTKATADYQGDAIGITTTADGARLHSGFQKLAGTVTTAGLRLESTEAEGGGLSLTASAIGRDAALQPSSLSPLPSTGTVSVQDKLVRWTRPGLVEEYSVSVDGLRQDFSDLFRAARRADGGFDTPVNIVRGVRS